MIVWGETGRCKKFRIPDAHGAVGEAGLDIRCTIGSITVVMAGDKYYFAYLLDLLELWDEGFIPTSFKPLD